MFTKTKPLRLPHFLLFLLLIDLASCGDRQVVRSQQPTTITIAKTMSPINLLLQVADQQAIWQQESLNVHEQSFSSARQAMDAIITNSSDLSTVADTPMLIAIHRNPNLKLLCTIATSDHHLALLLRSPGVKDTCDGLRGKRIALSVGTTQQYFLDYLIHNDAATCGIKITNLPPVDALTEFVSGADLDGIVAWEPQLAKAMEKTGGIADQNNTLREVFGLAYGPKSQLTDAALRQRVRAVLNKASNWITQHPDEAKALLATSQQVSPALAETLLRNYNFSIENQEQMIAGMADQEPWAKQKGFIESVFGVSRIKQILLEPKQ